MRSRRLLFVHHPRKPTAMRSYPRNSPEAAARLVALVLIADGHVCRTEFELLDRIGACRELGLVEPGFGRWVHELCEDLLMGACAGGSMQSAIDEPLLQSLLAEVTDPQLQHKLLRIAEAAAGADSHLAEGESRVLEQARQAWGLADTDLPPILDPAAIRLAQAAGITAERCR